MKETETPEARAARLARKRELGVRYRLKMKKKRLSAIESTADPMVPSMSVGDEARTARFAMERERRQDRLRKQSETPKVRSIHLVRRNIDRSNRLMKETETTEPLTAPRVVECRQESLKRESDSSNILSIRPAEHSTSSRLMKESGTPEARAARRAYNRRAQARFRLKKKRQSVIESSTVPIVPVPQLIRLGELSIPVGDDVLSNLDELETIAIKSGGENDLGP
jgi:hypothetical protein